MEYKVKLSVLVPALNEAHNLRTVIEAVKSVPLEKEIVVIDDGSTDDTLKVLSEYESDPQVVVRSLPHTRGKGFAIREGLQLATGDVLIIQDADLEYDPAQIPALVEPILEGRADVVYGSRFRGSIEGMHFANRLANYILTFAANLLYRAGITDEATCYKAFRTDLLRELGLQCEGFEFCPEVTAKVRLKGVRIAEVPISYVGRSTAQGKKVRWTDGFVAIWTLLKYRFGRP